MSDNPPVHALSRCYQRSYGARFRDVSLLVQHPEYDYRGEDLPEGTCVTVSYRGDNHTVYVVWPTGNYTRAPRKRTRDAATRRRFGRYLYRGQRFRTLSAVAAFITGDPTMSGNRFFQLRARRRG